MAGHSAFFELVSWLCVSAHQSPTESVVSASLHARLFIAHGLFPIPFCPLPFTRTLHVSNRTATLLSAFHLATGACCRVASPHLQGHSALLNRPTIARIPRLGFTIFLLARIISSTGLELTITSIARLFVMLMRVVLSSVIAQGLGERAAKAEDDRAAPIRLTRHNHIRPWRLLALAARRHQALQPRHTRRVMSCRPSVTPHAVGLHIIQNHKHVVLLGDEAEHEQSTVQGVAGVVALILEILAAKLTIWVSPVWCIFTPATLNGLVCATIRRGWYNADGCIRWFFILEPSGPSVLHCSASAWGRPIATQHHDKKIRSGPP
ncbi:hypothetical protein FIBSPDRAFT_1047659 [Athelia psychrophila]|uniref:Secreted protein n=1 Tax=Athelia psychrophila TaxID=1759441 RepID=A0A166F0F9_9AGAM|nr:hypothetical protein FIBSPDRAFT_1047659 [Fibularhizoctonia sp. CBS 109695]